MRGNGIVLKYKITNEHNEASSEDQKWLGKELNWVEFWQSPTIGKNKIYPGEGTVYYVEKA